MIPSLRNGCGVNCVYFHNSFSFSSPTVDGLLLIENDELQLCLNEFSNTCDVLRKSQLAVRIGEAVIDPAKFEGDKGKIVLRSSVSRKNECEVLDELERLTGVRYRTITLHRYNL